MPSWSVLRRSPPPMRCMPITKLRRFSHLTGTEVKQDLKSTPISFFKWVGGIITSSTLAFAFYSYSSFNYPSLSFSDTSQSLDHHRPKYLFGGKIFSTSLFLPNNGYYTIFHVSLVGFSENSNIIRVNLYLQMLTEEKYSLNMKSVLGCEVLLKRY